MNLQAPTILKNKYVIALLTSAAVVLIWYGWRQYNTQKTSEETGISFSEMEQYQGTDSWNYGPNWDGYEIGDDIPEVVK